MMRADLVAAIAASTTAGAARRTQLLADVLADIQDATPKHGIIVVPDDDTGEAILAQLATDCATAGLFTNQRSVLAVQDADPASDDDPTFVVFWEVCVGCPPVTTDRDVQVYYDHTHWEALIQAALDERPGTITGS